MALTLGENAHPMDKEKIITSSLSLKKRNPCPDYGSQHNVYEEENKQPTHVELSVDGCTPTSYNNKLKSGGQLTDQQLKCIATPQAAANVQHCYIP